ncbi:hypothetical protein K469DRAFT_748727 [Zopfia rhizophila CBS 207.26]|uniref:Uncharacterized protein n=1 Tax=Zopfia rhizophila CBS 207.26 TaxID=1314779 RepID=A0A6A6EBG7_9PEZI|nr:hypothetical protein K469DRAFT_748727 [Zopfia rhizophila CBS 207.26]
MSFNDVNWSYDHFEGNDTNYNECNDTSLADLGKARFDHDVAAIDNRRDTAFFSNKPVHLAQGRAPKGLEAAVFAWNTLQFTTDDKDGVTELKGDLHGGQLHRANRAAREPPPPLMVTRGRRGGRGGRGGRVDGGGDDRGAASMEMPGGVLVAGRKPDHEAPPCAKGCPVELSADMFWDEPLM